MANPPEYRPGVLWQKQQSSKLATLVEFVESFEGYVTASHQPNGEASLQLLFDYVEALYILRRYQSFLFVCDRFIECSVEQNLSIVKGRDLFLDALFMKAKVLYNKHRYYDATHIAENLRRINSSNSTYVKLLCMCYLKTTPSYIKHFRVAFILTSLGAALIVAVELFWIRIHMQEMVNFVESFRNILFISGTFLWLLSETIHLFRSYYRSLHHRQ